MLAGKAHAFENAIAVPDGVGHGVEGLGQILDFIAGFEIGAGGEISAGDFADDALEGDDGADQAAGLSERNNHAEGGAEDAEVGRPLVDQGDTVVIGLGGQSDVDPAPVDGGVIEGPGVAEDALADQRDVGDLAYDGTNFGAPEAVQRFDAPAVALDDDGIAVGFSDHEIVDGIVALEDLDAVFDDGAVVLRDGGASGDVLKRGGQALGL